MRRFRTPLLVAVAFVAGVGSSTLAQTATSTVTLAPGESVLVVAEDVATTVPPTTEPEPTVPPTTEPEPPATVGEWLEVQEGAGSLDGARRIIVPTPYPDATGVCFYLNDVFNRCDATGRNESSEFHFFPVPTLSAGDVLRAEWTDVEGFEHVDTYTVPAPEPEPTTPPTTEPEPTVPPTTEPEPPVSGVGFVETFDGNGGLDRFDYGVYHRDGAGSQTWQGDHSVGVGGADCGDPSSTSRTIRADSDEWIYVCRNHLMTSIADVSGYSTGWFTPKQTFTTERTVSWDANVTNLGGRQWWEVAIVPASFNSGVPECPQCSAISWLAPNPSGLPAYTSDMIIVGNGPGGSQKPNIRAGGQDRYSGWQTTCDPTWGWFTPSGACQSKAMRLTFSITDNANGTITVDYGGAFTTTFPGSFPDEFNVVFKDHNYTPDKDGKPVGYTWHWDTVAVV